MTRFDFLFFQHSIVSSLTDPFNFLAGDCYMAVTGVPKPQPDHAYRMAKFAVDCQAKTGVILHHLKDSLGKDTLNLSCRIGLHSGPGKLCFSSSGAVLFDY